MKKKLFAAILSIGLTGATVLAVGMPISPAEAIIVFDPSNYSQNILTAARTLQQINNQIHMLQNQAQSLINQARNLATIDFPELRAITETLQQIDMLMGQAQGIQFRVATLDQQFHSFFPTSFNAALTNDQHVVDARARLDTSMAAYKQTMTVQAGGREYRGRSSDAQWHRRAQPGRGRRVAGAAGVQSAARAGRQAAIPDPESDGRAISG